MNINFLFRNTLLLWAIFLASTAGVSAQTNCLDNFSAIASACSENGTFDVNVDMNYDATAVSDSFVLSGNGVIYGTYPYTALPVQINDLAGDGVTIYSFSAQDLANDTCTASAEIGVVFCPITACQYNTASVTAGACNLFGEYSATLFFTVQNPGNSGKFELLLNGVSKGTFFYADLPITINNLIGDGITDYEFLVQDTDKPDCNETLTLEAINCGNCLIQNMSVTPQPCAPDGTFSAVLNFTAVNPAGDTFQLLNGVTQTSTVHSYNDLPLTISGLQGDGTTVYGFQVQDIGSNSCFSYISLETVLCEETACTISSVDAEATPCTEQGFFNVIIDIEAQNNGASFVVVGNGNNYGTYNYADLPISLGPFLADGVTDYEFDIFDNDNMTPPCTNYADVGIIDCISALPDLSAGGVRLELPTLIAAGTIPIRIESRQYVRQAVLSIFNVNGAVLQSETLSHIAPDAPYIHQFTAAALASGLYIVQLEGDFGIIQTKFVVL